MGHSIIDVFADRRTADADPRPELFDNIFRGAVIKAPARSTPLSPPDEAALRFDYISKLFGIETRQGIESYLRSDRDQPPLVVDIDPTTACNFSCPECISADLLNKERIKTPRLQSLIGEIARAGTKGVIFIGGGEPLAHACMPEPIRLAYDAGMAVGLTTNGSLIDRHMATLAECVAWTRVSMDAATPETFQTFRPNKMSDSFGKIIRAMNNLAAVKKGALGYSFVIMRRESGSDVVSNIDEIWAAAKLSKDIGCDYFEAKPMFDMDHQLLPFLPDEERRIDEQLEMARTLEDGSFRIVATKSMAHLAAKRVEQPKSYTNCPTMSLRTIVTPTGIYPCAYLRGREDKKLGSIDDGPFDEFWRSDARHLAMEKTNPSVDCNFYCARHPINLTVNALSDLGAGGVDLLSQIEPRKLKDVFF